MKTPSRWSLPATNCYENFALKLRLQLLHPKKKRSCPLRPSRCFQHPSRVRRHIASYHVDRKQFVCSGTKQLKLCCALFDNAQLQGNIKGSYLKRSAAILRATVRPPLPTTVNEIDRDIRLVFTGLCRNRRVSDVCAICTIRKSSVSLCIGSCSCAMRSAKLCLGNTQIF